MPYYYNGEELKLIPKEVKKFSFTKSKKPVIVFNISGIYFIDKHSGNETKRIPWSKAGHVAIPSYLKQKLGVTIKAEKDLASHIAIFYLFDYVDFPDTKLLWELINELTKKFQIIHKYNAPNHKTALKIERGGFPDNKTYQEAQKVGANTFEQLTSNIKRGGFPNFQTYEEARLFGDITFRELQVRKKIEKEMLLGGFPDLQTYQKAKELGVDTFKDFQLINKYKAPDLATAKLIVQGNFPDYATYQEALGVGATNSDQWGLIVKYQAPDYDTVIKLQKGTFPDFSTYLEAKKAGAETHRDFISMKRLNAPDNATAFKIKEGNFPNYQTYQDAQKFRAKTFNQLQEIRKYNTPDYDTVVKIKKGRFPSYSDFKEAQKLGVKNYFQLELINQYNAPSFQIAKQKQLTDFSEKLGQLNRFEYEWSFSKIAKILLIPLTDVSTVLKELLSEGRIEGQNNPTQDSFISARPTEGEIKKIQGFISRIREGIPVSISRITEKTGLQKNRCERIVKDLTSVSKDAGEYLDLEGVFIKSGKSIEVLSGILRTFEAPEAKGAGIPFYCQIDMITHPATDVAYQCTHCARYLCSRCYSNLSVVGKINCPMCDGPLYLSGQKK